MRTRYRFSEVTIEMYVMQSTHSDLPYLPVLISLAGLLNDRKKRPIVNLHMAQRLVYEASSEHQKRVRAICSKAMRPTKIGI